MLNSSFTVLLELSIKCSKFFKIVLVDEICRKRISPSSGSQLLLDLEGKSRETVESSYTGMTLALISSLCELFNVQVCGPL